MTGMTTLPQGNQELLVVKEKVGRPQASLGEQVHEMWQNVRKQIKICSASNRGIL